MQFPIDAEGLEIVCATLQEYIVWPVMSSAVMSGKNCLFAKMGRYTMHADEQLQTEEDYLRHE